jgi:hypothetical protein
MNSYHLIIEYKAMIVFIRMLFPALTQNDEINRNNNYYIATSSSKLLMCL